MTQEENGSSSSTTSSSPLQSFSQMPLSSSPPTSTAPPPTPPLPSAYLQNLRSDERGLYLIHFLLNCVNHVSAGRLEHVSTLLQHISLLSTPDGDAMQRLSAAFSLALARRSLRPFPGLYQTLVGSSCSVSVSAVAAARHDFVNLCPFLRLAFAASNQAIVEAMEGEKLVHVIDLGASDPTQWIELLQLLAARPEGPPHLRLTAVSESKEITNQISLCLTKEAERLDIPFQFNAILTDLNSLDVDKLKVKTGEALAVSSVLSLHRLLSNSNCKMEDFLTALWNLAPKIMVVTEQESNHNSSVLTERFVEALNYYAALFDCLELTAPRNSVERARVERVLFGEEIKNIIASEGSERKERHERVESWGKRMEAAGFGRIPMGYYGLLHVRRMLQGLNCDGYRVREEKGCFFVCWQDRPLFSVSAWRCRRFD
ncbi:hypothetical protein LUZ61_017110 [Rhynchospora tenuis]|uniref:Scarecrow-like protein 3 n=1 Tax=Rhynchospora tenuis TaxID=198213 RepID=A0AAD6EKN6_9POAL|nr:hypothetical protein LUZ61_017110 [Rhynchospora tenuis]